MQLTKQMIGMIESQMILAMIPNLSVVVEDKVESTIANKIIVTM
jgi:hypothetical protein